MESKRDAITDERLFAEEITDLITPSVTAALLDVCKYDHAEAEKLAPTFAEVHGRLIYQFFRIMTDPKTGVGMYSGLIMMGLRKRRAERLKNAKV
jgi:hypothetical protein